MTWTYTIPWASDTDRIRSLIGDTDQTVAMLQNEEIQGYQAQSTNLFLVAAQCAYAIAAKYAHRVSQSVAASSIGADEIYRAYMDLGDQLSQQGGAGSGSGAAVLATVGVYAGGISVSDKLARVENSDHVQAVFFRRQFTSTQDIPPSEAPPWKP